MPAAATRAAILLATCIAVPAFASVPANVTPPTIAGAAVVDESLVAGPGTWTGTAPVTFSYTWLRCDSGGATCSAIDGATSQQYVVVARDLGHRLRVRVVASNASGSGSATSAPTDVVAAPPSPEVCGNCGDDDGNGLADDLDPACCADPLALLVRRVRVGAGNGGARLLLKLDLDATFAALDPTTASVSLQMADADGAAFCTSHAPWRKRGRRFRHHVPGTGVTTAVIRPRPGKAVFVAQGGRVDVAGLSPPELTVAVRIGTLCARGRATLVRKGDRLVTP